MIPYKTLLQTMGICLLLVILQPVHASESSGVEKTKSPPFLTRQDIEVQLNALLEESVNEAIQETVRAEQKDCQNRIRQELKAQESTLRQKYAGKTTFWRHLALTQTAVIAGAIVTGVCMSQ